MKNNKKGFTLVELVIVVAVMAILVAVAIPTIGSISGSARTSVNNTNAKTIESMIKLAEAEGSKTTAGASAESIAKVIADAKLGIEEGNFKYNTKSGKVEYSDAAVTVADGVASIAFAKPTGTATVGTVTVTLYGADGNPTATYNLDGTKPA